MTMKRYLDRADVPPDRSDSQPTSSVEDPPTIPISQDAGSDPGEADGWRAVAYSAGASTQCAVCLEEIPLDARICPECGERCADPAREALGSAPPSGALGAAEIGDPRSWLRAHWRPLITLSAVVGLLVFGIALRHLAPDRYQPPEKMPAGAAAAAEAACDNSCWHGESCQMGRCVWQPSNDVGHLGKPATLAGPFELPSDTVDVLPLDGERYAVSNLQGVRVANARTGGLLTMVSEAPHAQQLHRVGDAVYATSPRRIYVLDAAETRLLKTIELGTAADDLTVGASGQRVLASLPGARAVAVIATDYHAEVARFFFGDDHVRAVAVDDTGTRALTTNGNVPLPGLEPPGEGVRFGAMYAFDPSRLPSEQDRVRTALVGNPVDVVMIPDAKSSYALLREEDRIVRLERQESGAVRQESRLATCRQPEEIALVRRGRRAIVRCNAGKAVEVFDLETLDLIKHVPLNARAADMIITPDGRQAILALPRDTNRRTNRGAGAGAIGLLDLDSYELELVEVGAEPHRVRLAPDGRSAVVISDRKKLAWVVR
jgi:hypothetical protein